VVTFASGVERGRLFRHLASVQTEMPGGQAWQSSRARAPSSR
jgi:hypothetical protein